MRTTLAIDDDLLAAARYLSVREGRSLGEVISALADTAHVLQDAAHARLVNAWAAAPRQI